RREPRGTRLQAGGQRVTEASCTGGGHHRRFFYVLIGISTSNVAPPPGVSDTDTFPPCAAATAETMERPSPTPPLSRLRLGSARKKASKIRLASSARHPGPWPAPSTSPIPARGRAAP